MKQIFNEKQLKAIELLAQGGLTYIDVAKIVDVDVGTLRTWRKDQDFQDEVRKACRDLLKEQESFLYNAALEQIRKSGSYQHIKLLLERLERLEDISEGRGPAYDVMFTWKKNKDDSDAPLNY